MSAGAVTLGVGLGFTIGYTLQAFADAAAREKEKQTKEELNGDIIELIKKRMDKGRKEYGHGLLKGNRNWTKEALEEALDMSIYLSAKLAEMKSQ